MITKIRLSRTGTKNKPRWRVVVQSKGTKRDGKTLKILGFYEPRKENPVVKINRERLMSWREKGALVSPAVEKLLE